MWLSWSPRLVRRRGRTESFCSPKRCDQNAVAEGGSRRAVLLCVRAHWHRDLGRAFFALRVTITVDARTSERERTDYLRRNLAARARLPVGAPCISVTGSGRTLGADMATPDSTVWKIDPHTTAKHRLLRGYLDAWMPIITSSFPRVTIFEGYSGPGVYKDGEPGSPIIAMRALLSRSELVNTRKPVQFVFVEEREDRIAELERQVDRFFSGRPPWVRVEFVPGTCADTGGAASTGRVRGASPSSRTSTRSAPASRTTLSRLSDAIGRLRRS